MMSPKEFAALNDLLARTPMTPAEALFVDGLMRRFAALVEKAVTEAVKAHQEAEAAKKTSEADRADQSGLETNE